MDNSGAEAAAAPLAGGGDARTVRLNPLARYRGLVWPAVMALGILVVYVPPAIVSDGHILGGSDHAMLHARRLAYARDHLFSSEPRLPAWYTRELLGTPFWSNIQNFPFTPPRLVLLAFEPHVAYAVGVSLAALLTGLFTYLYCRRIGLRGVAAAAAGWTAACCGYFASRVMAGHLPLLEAFPALPLLLWLIEVCRGRGAADAALPDASLARAAPYRGALFALGVAAACVALCGHPQLPVYALVVAFLYAVLHDPRRWRIPAALVLGVGVAAFALLPMLGLIGRSTRVLGLNAPNNDVVLPYRRLVSFLFPWRDGWPQVVPRGLPHQPFMGHPTDNDTIFWDTVAYVGWLPILAAAGLVAWGAARLLRRGRLPLPPRPWPFIAAVGVISLLMALPPVHRLTSALPGTFLRSPSRLLYLTTFALALGLGAALEALLRWVSARQAVKSSRAGVGGSRPYAYAAYAAVAVALVAHGVDLGSHSRTFVMTEPLPKAFLGEIPGTRPGDGHRAAVDFNLWLPVNRRSDDVGFFDSVMLARPYRALLALGGTPHGYNTQVFNGSGLSGPALHVLGVKIVLASRPRADLPRRTDPNDPVHGYEVPSALPRAALLPLGAVRVLDRDAIQERFRRIGRDPGRAVELRSTMALPPDAPGAADLAAAVASSPPPGSRPSPPNLTFGRPSSDVIVVDVAAPQAGYVRVLEAWDDGWSATVDGQPADVAPGDDTFLAVRVPSGPHQVRLEYRTPYARAGIAVSLLSAVLLGLLALTATPRKLATAGG